MMRNTLTISLYVLSMPFFYYYLNQLHLSVIFYWVDFVGFLSAGIGGTGFFFINTMVLGSVIGQWSANSIYGEHMLRIREWWLKDKNGNDELYVEYIVRSDGSVDKKNWSRKKIIAFWLADHGVEYCFMLVFVGFLMQLSAWVFV